jgi:hypothetical protein
VAVTTTRKSTGQYLTGMVARKRRPALRPHLTAPTTAESFGQISPYGPGRHPQAELQPPLIGDPLLAPRRLSQAMRRIMVRSSTGRGGRPGRDFHHYHQRKPWRCQRIKVYSRTIARACRQSNQRESTTIARRVA